MTREWQPGNVAMVQAKDKCGESLAIRSIGLGAGCPCWETATGYLLDSRVTNVRPLITIDPESREEVERLAEAWRSQTHATLGTEPMSLDAYRMQAALREFASPTPPKPEEPTGDGAVVEDANGYRWVRIASQGESPDSPPWRHRGHSARFWASVKAVKVLSEGVTE